MARRVEHLLGSAQGEPKAPSTDLEGFLVPIERGINFFDTANMYSHGDSERILGEVLFDPNREEMVVATKAYFPPSEDPHRQATGLSRKTIEQELQNSLDRLGVDTIALYQIHRWDEETPIEESLQALYRIRLKDSGL